MKFDLKKFLKNLKLNEENISIVFGALVVLIMGILIVNYFKDNKGKMVPAENTEEANQMQSYSVKKGDSLWKIAKDNMGSGFKWQEIKKANNLNSDTIEIGQKLIIPEISVIQKTEKITSDTYTVVKGDSLWSIAVLAYGDGYKWSEIAKVNSLKNPSVIHAGNVLKLPR